MYPVRGNQIAIMLGTVNSLLAMKHILQVSSVKSVKHDGNLIIAPGTQQSLLDYIRLFYLYIMIHGSWPCYKIY